MKALIIAGVTSGVGKTTVATGLMGVLAGQKLRVQPFKTGPDYIDTSYHTWVTGNPSRNLDTWMLSHKAVIELFNRAMSGKDIGVIEGVMGLFDGHSATSDTASTAELAKLLNVPVILVVDSRNAARSLAAVVKGCRDFDPGLTFGGVILNGIGSETHYQICQDAIEHYAGVRVLGYLPRRESLMLPERHLGLVPTVEGPVSAEFRSTLLDQCAATLDIKNILQIAEQAAPPTVLPELFPVQPQPLEVRIGVARDRAFSFYYQDSLDLLEAWGAEIVCFSPLTDFRLPPDVNGLYIGGGFPEMYAAELAANESLKKDVKLAVERGIPVYAECGGLMYLGQSIRDFDGRVHLMSGVLPLESRIDNPKLTMGYRTVHALHDGPLLQQGQTARGHEFHWSNCSRVSVASAAYDVEEKGGGLEGFQVAKVLASYIHLHLGTVPPMARRFVKTCACFKENRRQ